MFCKNCGIKIDHTQKFCTNCGNELSFLTNTQSERSTPNFTKPKFKSSWNTGRIIAIVVVIGFIVWVASSPSDDTTVEKNNNAITAFDLGNSEQAISQFQEASQQAVSNENKIGTLKNLGYAYFAEGKTDESIAAFKQALDLASIDSFDYYLIAGEIAMLEQKPNAALISYNKAYAKNQSDFQINNALALFYMDIENVAPEYTDYTKALKHAQVAVANTDLQIVKQNLGMAYNLNEMYPQAISILSSLTIDKDTYTAYWLGLSYAGNNDPVNAKIYLRKAIANGVEVPQEVHDYLAEN